MFVTAGCSFDASELRALPDGAAGRSGEGFGGASAGAGGIGGQGGTIISTGGGGYAGVSGAGGAGQTGGQIGAGGTGGQVATATGGAPAVCVPGTSALCYCPTGQPGAQRCTSAGTFAACVCVAPVVDAGGIGGSGGTVTKSPDASTAAGGTTYIPTGGTTYVPTGGTTYIPTGGTTYTRTGGTSYTPTGGTTSAGGVTTVGGSTSSTPTGTMVTFVNDKAQGAMTGYGWVELGSADTISDPTCGPSKAVITAAAQCLTSANWNSTTALCVTGSVPALAATNPDYSGNWGLSVGVNAGDPAGTTGLGQPFTSITITVSGSPTTGLRAIVHRKGDADATQYCYPLTSGTAIPLTSFSTTCYTSALPGTAITAADVPNIDKVSVQVSSGTAAITVASLCITGISFQ